MRQAELVPVGNVCKRNRLQTAGVLMVCELSSTCPVAGAGCFLMRLLGEAGCGQHPGGRPEVHLSPSMTAIPSCVLAVIKK